MTENELTLLKFHCQLRAQEAFLVMLCNALARSFPSFGPSLREMADQSSSTYSQLVLKDYSAEASDLMAGEFQEAFESLIKFISANTNKK